MRALIAVVALLVLTGAAFWWLQQDRAVQAPPSAHDPDGPAGSVEPPPEPVAADGERETATPPLRPTGPDEPRASSIESGTEPGTGTGTEPGPARIRPSIVEARDAATNQLLPAFRWRFQNGQQTVRGASEAGVGELPLPPGATVDLLVEANGMQPATRKGLHVPTEAEPQLQLQLYLTPAVSAQGITLLVHDVDRRPVAHVRVDAFELDAQNRDGAWQLGKPMWARRTQADDGRYQLPPLPAGEYGIRLLATDADGQLLPMSPFRRAFALTGSNGFVEDVTLEPACALRVELLEPDGSAFDPKRHGNVTITLHAAGERGIQRKWTAARRDGSGTVSEADHVPAPSPIWLAEPVAMGGYTLEIFVNGDPRVHQSLILRAETQTERVTVR
ncbi:MAG: hypothetical protein ACE37K_01565 [Planctomycetota bacterium]